MFDKWFIYTVCGVVLAMFVAYGTKDLIDPDFEFPVALWGLMSIITSTAVGAAGAVLAIGKKAKKREEEDEKE